MFVTPTYSGTMLALGCCDLSAGSAGPFECPARLLGSLPRRSLSVGGR